MQGGSCVVLLLLLWWLLAAHGDGHVGEDDVYRCGGVMCSAAAIPESVVVAESATRSTANNDYLGRITHMRHLEDGTHNP